MAEEEISTEVEPGAVRVDLALTITDNAEVKEEHHPLEQTLIGIDLGEAGIGYSVFEVSDVAKGAEAMTPVLSGSIPIRSIRNLIRAVKVHRKKTQPNQRFQQRFNNSLEQLRDNAVGDTAHVIDTLCWRHKGIPVLESSLRNLASGAAQLKLIYDRILNLYIYSEVDAHKAVKKHHWCGGENWNHPSLYKEERKKMKDDTWRGTGKHKQLIMHPGVSVYPAGTSQVCSQCLENPISYLREFGQREKFTIGAGGEVTLPNRKVLLLKRRDDVSASDEENKANAWRYKRQKIIPRYQFPEKARTLTAEELLRLVRRQLRQPQVSSRSKDTSQSRYYCVYKDCGHEMHADENAAINIVRKWVHDAGIQLQA
jgi:hypothetical protein